jgi:hypothetical protein
LIQKTEPTTGFSILNLVDSLDEVLPVVPSKLG